MIRVAVALALLASPALAKDMTITLTDQDQQTELAALDAYVRASGLNVAPQAVVLLQKLQQAAQAQAPAVPSTPPNNN